MTRYLMQDDGGTPRGVVDTDELERAATLLGFRLAVVAGDDLETERMTTQALEVWGADAFGFLAAATLRHVVDNVLAPVLDVCDELHKAGALSADLRDGLADALANAEATLGGDCS